MDGYLRGPREGREVVCPSCSQAWEVVGYEEYGTWWPERDDDLVCGQCEAEAE